ncbi:MAG: RNA polymerase sigma factor [Deltaproteobacteria bacterium]|nr:RNA polymerase sigma factor [Deltaproteobacteria bacterium]
MTVTALDFSSLYDAHVDGVCRALAAYGVPRSGLEDAVQEVFIVAYRRGDSFEGRASPRTWLISIARRVASRWHRTARRTDRRIAAIAATAPQGPDLERAYACHEAADRVATVLASIDAKQREAFVLSDIAGLSRLELAAALGVNPNTAWGRVRAARAAITRELGEVESIEQLLAGTPTIEPSARPSLMGAILLRLGVVPTATASVKLGWLGAAAIVGAVAAVPVVMVDGRDDVTAREPSAAPAVSREQPSLPASAQLSAVAMPPRRDDAFVAPAAAPARTNPRGRAAPTRMATPSDNESLAAERASLSQVRSAVLRGAHDDALAQLQRHATKFPSGALAPEAAQLRSFALCGLGRDAEARALGGEHACDLTNVATGGDQPR